MINTLSRKILERLEPYADLSKIDATGPVIYIDLEHKVGFELTEKEVLITFFSFYYTINRELYDDEELIRVVEKGLVGMLTEDIWNDRYYLKGSLCYENYYIPHTLNRRVNHSKRRNGNMELEAITYRFNKEKGMFTEYKVNILTSEPIKRKLLEDGTIIEIFEENGRYTYQIMRKYLPEQSSKYTFRPSTEYTDAGYFDTIDDAIAYAMNSDDVCDLGLIPSTIHYRANMLYFFSELKYSARSQEVIVNLFKDVPEELREDKAKKIVRMMISMTEEEVIERLTEE